LADKNNISGSEINAADFERLKQRLELIDERMDNMDSVLTAVAERIMKQPVSITLNCPHCGKNIEVALVGQQKPT